MKKKYIILSSIFLGIIIVLTIFLICFYSIPRITYTYDEETDSYFVDKVYGNASTYTIKDFVQDKPVIKIASRAFMNKTNLKEVELGKNITRIERLAFLDCKKLEKIDLTTVDEIGRNAFENCISLKEVHIGASTILGGVFMGCTSLEVVVLDGTNSIGSYAFANTAIKEIIIPEECTLVGENAFFNCNELYKIEVLSKALFYNPYLNSLNIVIFNA